ncbi:restriction endonuclease subunit S [uncultured Lactobacillus sp.]|uniref:restriction endonuclease subunit S n=1 Tax=uncultured Lactobacillus sp. TaxID=153152 RepID=UPI00259B3084|nr:restriction endonuclease subunit S [uncultured Lactobacillus sp.]MCT7689636.1 restriction endonuclease subunit S [Lactobacillus crispatus]MCT7698483.1 restriction endonuclease subunit S [Lactobacillus crispatus]
MTPEQLKASILQYAMEGKLVKQNLNDISAIQNLKEAREKIKEAIKNKELRKEKYTQAENNGKLPKNWGVARLKEICEKNNSSIKRGPFGSSITKSMFVPKGKDTYKVYEQGNAIRRDINYGSYYITKDKFESLSAFQVKTGDIIVSCAGTIGKTFILPPKIEPGIINQALLKLTLDTSIIDKKFFLLEFESISVQLNLHAKGSAIKNLASLKYLKNKVDFPLPPIEEQKRIVAKIEKLMPLVDEYAESYNRLQKIDNEFEDKLKQSVLQYAMEGKLVKQDPSDEPASELIKKIENEKAELVKEGKIKKSKKLHAITDDEKPFDIPDSWEWVSLGQIINLISGRDIPKKDHLNKEIKGSIPYITGASNIDKNGNINISEWVTNPTVVVNKGTILLSVKGTIGKISILDLAQAHIARQIMGIDNMFGIDKKYLQYYIESYVQQLQQKAKSIIPGISRDDLLLAILPLPPIKEQERIVIKLERLLSSINSLYL